MRIDKIHIQIVNLVHEDDLIVNGVNEKRKANKEEAERIKKMMATKYKSSVHVDNETVLCKNPSDTSYNQNEIFDGRDEWSKGIIDILRNI